MNEVGGRRHDGASGALALVAALLLWGAVPAVGAAQVAPGSTASAPVAPSENVYNDQLMQLTPEQRAARLARFIGGTCIGSSPFLMGVTKAGKAKGYAYWSLQCAGDTTYMIQLAPDGEVAAMDCTTLKQNGGGRECYKKF